MSCKKRLVLIDNDEGRRYLVAALQDAGFVVIESLESDEGVRHVVEDVPHTVLMSEAMPPINGTELLPVLRRLTKSPIIVLGSGDETAVVWAFLEGADAYLVREVSIRELLARLHALLRRHEDGYDLRGEHQFGFFLDKDHLDQILSQLSQTEARLFRYLLEQGGRLIDREELVVRVWGERGKDTSLRFYIRQLRRKLASLAQASSIEILTRKGKGYRLQIDPPVRISNQPAGGN